MRRPRTLSAGVLLVACGNTGSPAPDARPRPAPAATSPGEASPGAPSGTSRPRRCVPPPGVSGSPSSIAEAVALLNALPAPVTVACFVESLDRPLRVFASASPFSAQPSSAIASPRLFIRQGPLTMTVVPEGLGQHLLEFGERAGPGRTLKGEVELPPAATLSPSAPFEQVQVDDGTTCGVCHDHESAEGPGFVSEVLHPSAEFDVPLSQLHDEAIDCGPAPQDDRCRLLVALFGHGPVVDATLPAGGRICDH